jgi:hypothetical protein
MSAIVSRSRRLGILATTAIAIALAVPAAVSADTGSPPTIFPAESRGATVEVSTRGIISARLIATIRVNITCEPLEMFDWETGQTSLTTEGHVEFTNADLLQVSGRTINWGSAPATSPGNVVCDGETVTPVTFTIIPQNLPWKSGSAVVGVRIQVVPPDFSSGHFASSGAVEIHLSK